MPGLVSSFRIITPNPFNDKTNIRFYNPSNQKYRFIVTDLSGKVLRINDHIYTGEIEFERMSLPPGCYIFELRGPKLYRGNLLIE